MKAVLDLEDDYLRHLVLEAFGQRSCWQLVDASGWPDGQLQDSALGSLLQWGEYERIDWERVHAGELHASAYCVRKGLIRKAHLAHNMRKWAAKHPGGCIARGVPEAFILELDDIDYIEEALCDVPEVRDMPDGSATWIAKPSLTNQAIGVCIFDSVAGLIAALQAHEDLREWVLQRYIERPLLVRGRKWHLRAYALCAGSLRAWVLSEALALFAAEPYHGAMSRLGDLDAHLTNTCRVTAGGAAAEEDTVQLLSELPGLLAAEAALPLREAEQRCRQVMQDANALIGECLEAVSGELTFFTLPNCFELFGFDLLVDKSWHVWLLEANAEPDFQQTGSRLKPMVASLVEGTLRLVADPLAAERGCGCRPQSSSSNDSAGSRAAWVQVLDKASGRAGGSGMTFT